MDKITELAKLFKERDNPTSWDITTATVVKLEPLTLKLSDKIFLSKEYNNLLVSSYLAKGYINKVKLEKFNSNPVDKLNPFTLESLLIDFQVELTYPEQIKIGDELIVIPISSGKLWYAIDKVVRI